MQVYPGLLLLALVEPVKDDTPLCDVELCPFAAQFSRGNKRVCGQHAIGGA